MADLTQPEQQKFDPTRVKIFNPEPLLSSTHDSGQRMREWG